MVFLHICYSDLNILAAHRDTSKIDKDIVPYVSCFYRNVFLYGRLY